MRVNLISWGEQDNAWAVKFDPELGEEIITVWWSGSLWHCSCAEFRDGGPPPCLHQRLLGIKNIIYANRIRVRAMAMRLNARGSFDV